jgi:hypothetical protein
VKSSSAKKGAHQQEAEENRSGDKNDFSQSNPSLIEYLRAASLYVPRWLGNDGRAAKAGAMVYQSFKHL